MTILKKDYEACFKEGFKLGTRLTRSKLSYMKAKDAELVGDKEMAAHITVNTEKRGETWLRIVGVNLRRPRHTNQNKCFLILETLRS